MADDVTLRLGAEAAQAIDTLEKVQKSLAKIVDQVNRGTPIYDQFGNVASAATTKVTETQEKAAKSTSLLDSAWGKLTGAFAAATLIDKAVTGLFRLGTEAITSASRILDLRDTTGMSVEALQQLEFVEAKTSTRTGALSDAAYKLSLALAGGDTSVRDAVEAVGLSYDALLAMRPEDRFLTVVDRLAGMADETDRNNIAVQLFGKQWKDIAPAVVAGIREIGAAAKTSNEEQLQALSEAQQAYNGFWANAKSTATSVFGEIVLAFQDKEAIFDTARRQRMRDEELAAQNDQADRARSEASLGRERTIAQVRTTTHTDYVTQLADTKKKVAALTDEQRANIVAGLALGKTTEDIVTQTRTSAAVVELYKDRLTEQKQAQDEATRTATERLEAEKNLRSSLATLTAAQVAQIAALLKANKSESDIAKVYGFTAQQVREVAKAEKDRADAEEASIKVLEQARKEASAQNLEQNKREEAAAKAAMDSAAKLYDAYLKIVDRRRLAERTGTDQRLEEIAQQEAAELRAAESTYDVTSGMYADLTGEIRRYYQHQRDLATGTASTIEQRMRAQGVFTRAELELSAANAKRDYDQMRASGQYTAEQLQAAFERWYNADAALRGDWAGGWRTALSEAAAGFQQLADIAGGSMSEIARGIGTGLAASEQLMSGFAQIGKGGARNLIAGMSSLIGAAATIGQLLYDAFTTPAWERVMRDVGERWGVEISEGLAQEIADLSSELRNPQGLQVGRGLLADTLEYTRDEADALAELLSLDKIIAESGGLTSATAEQWMARAKPLFDVIKKGGEEGAAATRTLVTLLGQFGALATETGGLWSQAFQDMLAEARELGVGLEEIGELTRQEADKAASALGGITSSLEGNQDALDRTSRIALATFNAIVESGRSPVEAIEAIGGSIDAIRAGLENAGLTGSAAFNELSRWQALVTTNAPLLTQVGDLNTLMVALANLGSLSADTFADLQAQGVAAFAQLTAAGFTEQEALAQMAPLLETIRRLHVEKNLPIDEGTQALLNQAEAAGVLHEQEASAQQILKEGFTALLQALNVDLPEGWKKAADAAKDAAGGISESVGEVDRRLDENERAWSRWGKLTREEARATAWEVDRVSLGHSPGGLKEIPLLLRKSQDAASTWRYDMVDQMRKVQAVVDAFDLPSGGSGVLGGDGAAAGTGYDPSQAAMDPSGSAGGREPLLVRAAISIGAHEFGEVMIPIAADAIAQGRVPVPARTVRPQVSRG